MRVLHLAAGNRWTGAAAPAFAEVEALRGAGVEAHYAYVGGYKLEEKLRGVAFAHPIIAKAQNPRAFLRTVSAIRSFIDAHHIDVVHAHLTWDHWLARFATRGRTTRIARTFHSRRTLRTDPLTQSLLRRTSIVAIINEEFRDAAALRGRTIHFTPPPVDERQFTPAGANVRHLYGIEPNAPVIAVIGKLARGRGFEDALRTFALIRSAMSAARLLVIGHGEHRPVLESLAAELRIAENVIWAGYHEDDLAEHYRAANALLFTAAGSDEGHRAVIEAMACGIPPAMFPIEGLRAIVGNDLSQRLVAERAAPEALAELVIPMLRGSDLPAFVAERAHRFGFEAAASRLLTAYRERL